MQPRTWIIENLEQMSRLAGYLPRLIEYPLEISVKGYVPKRTVEQNARLWKLHTMASEITGYTPVEMHEEALCHHFGYVTEERMCILTGSKETKRVPLKRSSQRDKKEFRAFMDSTEMWYANELGVWLE